MPDKQVYRLAFQGAAGAYSQLACIEFARKLALEYSAFEPCDDFEGLLELAARKSDCLAVLPLENSTIGSLKQNYALLWDSGLRIISEIKLPIHHHLLALEGVKIEDLKEVYSHPVALAQCKKLFIQHPHLKAVEYADTALAAAYIRDNELRDFAAIAGIQAAAEYGLTVLEENVEDYSENATRFLLLAGEDLLETLLLPEHKGPRKIIVGFECRNMNQLFLLSSLFRESLELCKLETLPIPDQAWNNRVFLESMLYVDEPRILSELKTVFPDSRVFGCYIAIN
ncbi:MAG: hypothetical protein K2X27_26345 [Candidatus Obscuribacterales bacterium]|nr:hypothetical protein [Candidatus Obscuribacterales bacterium]